MYISITIFWGKQIDGVLQLDQVLTKKSKRQTQEHDELTVAGEPGNITTLEVEANQEHNQGVKQIDVEFKLEEVKLKEDEAKHLFDLDIKPLLNRDSPNEWRQPYIERLT